MWLYLPPSLFAPDQEQWTLDSAELSQAFASRLTWRGKPLQPRIWLRKFKEVYWMTRLSGTIYPTSLMKPLLDRWISRLEA